MRRCLPRTACEKLSGVLNLAIPSGGYDEEHDGLTQSVLMPTRTTDANGEKNGIKVIGAPSMVHARLPFLVGVVLQQ